MESHWRVVPDDDGESTLGEFDDPSLAETALDAADLVSVKGLLLGGGPRFARDAFGPVLAFYVGWKLAGLVVGIIAASVVSVAAWRYERRRERPGAIARLSLGFVVIQAVIGLVSGSAAVYLAQPVLLSAALGIVFLVSAVIGRPLAGVFANELYPFPPEVRDSATFRRVFGRISVAWGSYQLLRSAIRLLALAHGSIESFLVINLVTGVPLTAGLMAWSIWYGVRGFRRSDEWGWALRGEAAPIDPPRPDDLS